jgi:hypothetical protein
VEFRAAIDCMKFVEFVLDVFREMSKTFTAA